MRITVKKVFGTDTNFKTKVILTDESQAEMTGISRAFNDQITVRNCLWHKKLTFERNLDVMGVNLAKKAMYAITELECMNSLLLIVLEYKNCYDLVLKRINEKDRTPYQWKVKMWEVKKKTFWN